LTPIGGIFLKIHIACVLHFSTGIEELASPCGLLISRHQLDKWLGGYKSQTECNKSEKSCPCPKSKHSHPAPTQTVYDNFQSKNETNICSSVLLLFQSKQHKSKTREARYQQTMS